MSIQYNEETVHPAEIHRIDEHLKLSDIRIAACEKTSADTVSICSRLTTLIERHDGDIEKNTEKIERLEHRPITLFDKILITAAATLLSALVSFIIDIL